MISAQAASSPLNSSAFEAYESCTAGRKKPAPALQSQPAAVKVEEAADRGIPNQLKPDKLLANEEFYEELRESMRQVEAGQEEPGTFTKYSHHLGRAEFGTLKKRPSAATSRDPSGDRHNQHRVMGKFIADLMCFRFQNSKTPKM